MPGPVDRQGGVGRPAAGVLPDRSGPWQTAYHRFNALRRTGALDRMVGRPQLRLDAAGLIDHRLDAVDGTNVRAARAAGGGKNPPAR